MRRHASSSYPFGLPDSLPFLFNGGEDGAIYDPSILSSLYQDSAKTTPVTAYGDPVGAIEDQSGNGNDALQATSGSRPLYARMPKTGLNNKIYGGGNNSENFTAYTNSRLTIGTSPSSLPSGITSGTTLRQAAGQTVAGFVQTASFAVTAGARTIKIRARDAGKNYIAIRETLFDGTANDTFINVATGAAGTTDAAHTPAITADDNGYFLVEIAGTVNAGRSGYIAIYNCESDNSFSVTDNQLGVDVTGLEFVAAGANYQKVVSAYDVTESGIEDAYCFDPDDTDDYMSADINTVDLSGAWELVVGAYFKTTPTTDTLVTLSNLLTNATEWAGIAIDSSSRPIITTNGKTSGVGTAITAGSYVFRLRWDGTQFKLWVNGVLNITETPSAITWSGVDYIVLGAVLDATPEYSNANNFCTILDVRSLSDSEANLLDRIVANKCGASI